MSTREQPRCIKCLPQTWPSDNHQSLRGGDWFNCSGSHIQETTWKRTWQRSRGGWFSGAFASPHYHLRHRGILLKSLFHSEERPKKRTSTCKGGVAQVFDFDIQCTLILTTQHQSPEIKNFGYSRLSVGNIQFQTCKQIRPSWMNGAGSLASQGRRMPSVDSLQGGLMIVMVIRNEMQCNLNI